MDEVEFHREPPTNVPTLVTVHLAIVLLIDNSTHSSLLAQPWSGLRLLG